MPMNNASADMTMESIQPASAANPVALSKMKSTGVKQHNSAAIDPPMPSLTRVAFFMMWRFQQYGP